MYKCIYIYIAPPPKTSPTIIELFYIVKVMLVFAVAIEQIFLQKGWPWGLGFGFPYIFINIR